MVYCITSIDIHRSGIPLPIAKVFLGSKVPTTKVFRTSQTHQNYQKSEGKRRALEIGKNL